MKIRLEGTQEEINNVISRVKNNYMPNGKSILEIKTVSKFYPNRVNSTALLNGVADTKQGRVYLEIS